MTRCFRNTNDNTITVVNEELAKFFSVYGIDGWNEENQEWDENIFSDTTYLEKDGEDLTLVFLHGNDTIEYRRGIDADDYTKFRFGLDHETEYNSLDELYKAVADGEVLFSGLIKWDGSNHTLFNFVGGVFEEFTYTEVEFETIEEIATNRDDTGTKHLYATWENGDRALYIGTTSQYQDLIFEYLEPIEQDDVEELEQFGKYRFENEGGYALVESTEHYAHKSEKDWAVVAEFSNEGAAELEFDIRSAREDRVKFDVVKRDKEENAWFSIFKGVDEEIIF